MDLLSPPDGTTVTGPWWVNPAGREGAIPTLGVVNTRVVAYTILMPNQHKPGYEKAYHAARSRTVTWTLKNLPALMAAARGDDVDIDAFRDQLRDLADTKDLVMP